MDNKLAKFVKFRLLFFKLWLIFLGSGGSLLMVVGLSQVLAPNAQVTELEVCFILVGLAVAALGLGLIVCLPFFLFRWFLERQELTELSPATVKKAKIIFTLVLGYAFVAVLFIGVVNFWHLDAKSCDSAECFLNSANKCEAVKWQNTDSTGLVWSFYSAPYCRLEKKLLGVTGNESREMKNILQGQALTCDYKKAFFDPLWVKSLIYDLEPCEGNLKESIAKLLLLLNYE